MHKLQISQLMKLACRATDKWGVYIEIRPFDDLDEVLKAAPYLSVSDDAQIIADGCGVILCDSKEEAERIFYQTVGDDGPTETNPYNGPARVYAMTCSDGGMLLNENT